MGTCIWDAGLQIYGIPAIPDFKSQAQYPER